jgi:hypothetical protein
MLSVIMLNVVAPFKGSIRCFNRKKKTGFIVQASNPDTALGTILFEMSQISFKANLNEKTEHI